MFKYGFRTYQTDNDEVKVFWRKFSPKETINSKKTAVIFFCGWSGGEDRKSVESLNENLAEFSGCDTYAISTLSKYSKKGLIERESKVIYKFLKESKINRVIITGHSLGGAKALNLGYFIEKMGGIKILGLILFNSAGLYRENRSLLARIALLDTVFSTPKAVFMQKEDKSLIKKAIRADIDMISGIIDEIKETKLNFLKRTYYQLNEISNKNPYFDKISSPIVLLQGKKDPISDYRKIIIENSNVQMLVEDKLGIHGLPLFRSEFSARETLKLLNI